MITLDLVSGVHFKIKENKRGKKKFKLRGQLKKFLKRHNIGYYFLWGNDWPTQIVLRNIDEETLFLLQLSF
jgi:hypothetical protein